MCSAKKLSERADKIGEKLIMAEICLSASAGTDTIAAAWQKKSLEIKSRQGKETNI